jgi:hypothetical protein
MEHSMSGRFWLAFAAYAVPTFLIGYFWHLSLFAAEYERLEVYRDDLLIPFGATAIAMQGAIYAWAYPRLFSTAHDAWLGGALRFGLIFGALAWSLIVLSVAAKNRMNSVEGFMLLETGFVVLQYLVVSTLIALAWRQPANAQRPAT